MTPETGSCPLFIGLMSGTSADGADCALVDFAGLFPELRAFTTRPYPPALQNRIRDLAQGRYGGADAIELLGSLDGELGEFFAETVCALLATEHLPPEAVAAIGSHGQTIRHAPHHAPYPFTLQIGDPNRIAARTGIMTVADFRRMDLAHGGQGAPLVPGFLQHVFSTERSQRVFLNIGGIANVTLWSSPQAEATGFDTGPGNTLIDAWVRQQTGHDFDRDGFYSGQGRSIPKLLERLLDDPYFAEPPPKSTGPEYFSHAWLEARLHRKEAFHPVDVARTLVSLTAVAAARAIRAHAPEATQVAVSGGGAKNPWIMAELKAHLPGRTVSVTDKLGLDPDALEAMAFAWLAQERLRLAPGSLPSVTGARTAGCLGAVYFPGPRGNTPGTRSR